MRVQLKPGLRRAWRSADSIQIGLGPGHGTVIAGLDPAEAGALDRFAQGVDLPASGGSPQVVRQRRMAQLLHEAGLLLPGRTGRAALSRLGPSRPRLAGDAAVWGLVHEQAGDGWGLLADRAGRHVAVVGAGRTGAALATLLNAAGVGRVAVSDPRPVTEADLMPGGYRPEDVGRRREQAVADRLVRPRPAAPPPAHPDLVVLVGYAVADAGRAEPLLRTDVPHLAVVLRGHGATVGPLVVPGQGPCLRCLDLHRGDRDPAWPKVLAQLLYPPPPVDEPEECASAHLVAGLAALQVLAWLDGVPRPAARDATLEVELPDGLVARRSWTPHPGCGCHWPPRETRPARRPTSAAGKAPGSGPDGGPVAADPVSDKRDPRAGSTMSG